MFFFSKKFFLHIFQNTLINEYFVYITRQLFSKHLNIWRKPDKTWYKKRQVWISYCNPREFVLGFWQRQLVLLQVFYELFTSSFFYNASFLEQTLLSETFSPQETMQEEQSVCQEQFEHSQEKPAIIVCFPQMQRKNWSSFPWSLQIV